MNVEEKEEGIQILPGFLNQQIEYSFFGLKLQQNNFSFSLINFLLEEENPELVVEFGSRTGGLSTLLAMYCYFKNSKFITFEFAPESNPLLYEKEVRFFNGSIVYEDFSKQESLNLIKEESLNKKTIYFCDATKVNEFNYFSDIMKKNDIIMAHDYAHDEGEFEVLKNNRIWFCNEIKYKDIKEACQKNNLEYINHSLYKASAWGIFKKIK